MDVIEYATNRGVDSSLIYRWLREGRFGDSANKIKGKWLIIEDKADLILDEILDPAQRKKPSPPDTHPRQSQNNGADIPPFSASKAEQAFYKAKTAELEYKKLKGTLILAADAERATMEFARNVRDAMLNIPPRMAAILSAERNPHAVMQKLLTEINLSLRGCGLDKKAPLEEAIMPQLLSLLDDIAGGENNDIKGRAEKIKAAIIGEKKEEI